MEQVRKRAFIARKLYQHWIKDQFVLHEFQDWERAVQEAQKIYPGTDYWLMSCSASEGGHGRWVPNSQGSGAGGWLQFMESTFWRMYGAARVDAISKGYKVPTSSADWYSPLGQALAGAWGVTHGRKGEWWGGGCQ